MSKRLLNEIHRFQEIAGIKKEIRVGSDGTLMDEEGIVKQALSTRSHSLSKIINALHKNPSYTRAKEALNLWVKDIAQELGINIEDIPTAHSAFTGKYTALQALPIIRQIFIDLLKGDLMEDDYSMGTASGDTDSINIAEDDFSDTSRGLDDTPLP